MTQEMTPTRRALAAVLGGRTDYVPPANPLAQTTKDLMEFCGATWPKAHRDPVMMADLAAAPYEVCGIEAARPQFDISLEAEVLGCRLDWNKPDRPPVTGPAYKDPKDISWDGGFYKKGRAAVVLDAIKILRERYCGDLPIIPVITAPFTVADCGTSMHASWECSGCMTCVRSCPEDALVFEDGMFRIDTGRCLGTACCRCQEGCPEKIFDQGSGPGISHPDRPCC